MRTRLAACRRVEFAVVTGHFTNDDDADLAVGARGEGAPSGGLSPHRLAALVSARGVLGGTAAQPGPWADPRSPLPRSAFRGPAREPGLEIGTVCIVEPATLSHLGPAASTGVVRRPLIRPVVVRLCVPCLHLEDASTARSTDASSTCAGFPCVRSSGSSPRGVFSPRAESSLALTRWPVADARLQSSATRVVDRRSRQRRAGAAPRRRVFAVVKGYRAIRDELRAAGAVFASDSDSEIDASPDSPQRATTSTHSPPAARARSADPSDRPRESTPSRPAPARSHECGGPCPSARLPPARRRVARAPATSTRGR